MSGLPAGLWWSSCDTLPVPHGRLPLGGRNEPFPGLFGRRSSCRGGCAVVLSPGYRPRGGARRDGGRPKHCWPIVVMSASVCVYCVLFESPCRSFFAYCMFRCCRCICFFVALFVTFVGMENLDKQARDGFDCCVLLHLEVNVISACM